MNDEICTCAPVYLNSGGNEPVGYEWRENCKLHGLDSLWYNSQEQIDKRQRDSAKLIDLQRQASEARRNSK